MDSRPTLQEVLERIPGIIKVYFNPPESVKMKYPCIRYSLKDIDIDYANNSAYNKTRGYTITLICEDPNNEFIDFLVSFAMCSFDRHYKADNLNHYVFTLYY